MTDNQTVKVTEYYNAKNQVWKAHATCQGCGVQIYYSDTLNEKETQKEIRTCKCPTQDKRAK